MLITDAFSFGDSKILVCFLKFMKRNFDFAMDNQSTFKI